VKPTVNVVYLPGTNCHEETLRAFRHVGGEPRLLFLADALAGLSGQTLDFPCAHGEGRFVAESTDGWRAPLRYPTGDNPDGSVDGVAGVTTPDRLAFGLMNHPERALDPQVRLAFFANGVRAARGCETGCPCSRLWGRGWVDRGRLLDLIEASVAEGASSTVIGAPSLTQSGSPGSGSRPRRSPIRWSFSPYLAVRFPESLCGGHGACQAEETTVRTRRRLPPAGCTVQSWLSPAAGQGDPCEPVRHHHHP
jgi:hypothetical protein